MESLIEWFRAVLLPYGTPGLVALGFLDATVVPMPQIFDIAVMLSCALQPEKAWAYVTAVTLGSTAGYMLVFAVARFGRRVLGNRASGPWLDWAENVLRRYGLLTVIITAVMPAPFPFKHVVLAAGYLRQRATPFLLALLAGRATRFTISGLVAVLYGQTIIEVFLRYALPIALSIVAVLISLALLYRRLRVRWTPAAH